MNIFAANKEVGFVADTVVDKAALPWRMRGLKAMGEAALDQAHSTLEGDILRGEKQVHVVTHDDIGVEFVVASLPVVLKHFDEELGITLHLEDGTAL